MKMTITAGPIACAASGEGAMLPTANPTDELAKLSKVKIPRNLPNLHFIQGLRTPSTAQGLKHTGQLMEGYVVKIQCGIAR